MAHLARKFTRLHSVCLKSPTRSLTTQDGRWFLSNSRLATQDGRYFTSDSRTVDAKEVEFFGSESMVTSWWKEPNILVAMNRTRISLIRDALASGDASPLDGISIVDIGCGGGILCEPLVRLGATVTGIDAAPHMIKAAQQHASLDPMLNERLRYLNVTSSDLLESEEESFDAVVASEVVEHVADVEGFVEDCVRLAKPGGSIFFTTINQTLTAYLVAILFAEGIGSVPAGTHHYEKLVTPDRLKNALLHNNCSTRLIRGHRYNFLANRWSWTRDTSVCYALHAIKDSAT